MFQFKNEYNWYVCKKCEFASDSKKTEKCRVCGDDLVLEEGTLKMDFSEKKLENN